MVLFFYLPKNLFFIIFLEIKNEEYRVKKIKYLKKN